MITHQHRTLARSLDALVGADGPLNQRLANAASLLATLEPWDFNGWRLQKKFNETRTALIMLDAATAELDARAAMTMAIRVIDLCFAVARQSADDDDDDD